MIQINLVPDIKQEFLRARKVRNLAISLSTLIGVASVALVVVLSIVLGIQYGLERYVDGQIDKSYAELTQNEDLSDIVTIQNQLGTISGQHDNKSMDSRLFAVLSAINPSAPDDSQFTSVKLIPDEATLEIEGMTSGGYPATVALKKTIENTSISYTDLAFDEAQTAPLATSVAIDESNYAEDSDGRRVVRYKISIAYNDILFGNTAKKLQIVAPTKNIDVTDSRLRVPDSLFAAPVAQPEGSD